MKLFTAFFLCIFLIPSVLGVGFANPPAQREFLFTPGGHIEIPIIVTGGNRLAADISSQNPGNLETLGTPDDNNIMEYVHIDDAAPLTGMREVKVVFDLPQRMKPGVYEVDFHVSNNENTGGGMVSAVASAKMRLTLRVLSDEKLLEILGLDVVSVAEGLETNASVHFISRTTQKLNIVRATFTVENIDAKSPAASLDSAATGSLSARLPVSHLKGGEYPVRVSLAYDDKVAEYGPVILKIGTLHVNLVEHTREFTYNTTNKFTFTLGNQWNKELQDVAVFVTINDQEKKTASLNIPPFGTQDYEVYFDRDERLVPGETAGSVRVLFKDYDPVSARYAEKDETFPITVMVTQPAAQESPMPIQQIVLYGSLILLALLLACVLILLLRKKNVEQKKVE